MRPINPSPSLPLSTPSPPSPPEKADRRLASDCRLMYVIFHIHMCKHAYAWCMVASGNNPASKEFIEPEWNENL